MPELPEIETIRSGLQNLKNKKIIKVFRSEKKLRIDSSLDLQGLVGLKILEITRRARYLIINFKTPTNEKRSLIIHLGMSGKLVHATEFRKLKHDHFACEFDDGSWLIFNDARRFGFVDFIMTKNLTNHKMLARLGCEPLSSEFNSKNLEEKLRGKKMNIKTTMMDNAVVVGVGNIYINESLFDAKISPLRHSCDLSRDEITRLVSSIKKIIAKAIELKGSSISDYVDSKGNAGNFQNSFKVYGRDKEKCLICKDLVKKITQNGRSSFHCSNCQK